MKLLRLGGDIIADEQLTLAEIIAKHKADLSGADLSGADLSGANLSRANLQGADLSRAHLSWADLSWANLSRAHLSRANLSWAKNAELATAMTVIVPAGEFIAWKKCRDNKIVKLLIPARAKRSSASGRKFRAEYVKVLEVVGGGEAVSSYTEDVVYRKGKIVRCDKWNPDRWTECGGGIHFFITKEEAQASS